MAIFKISNLFLEIPSPEFSMVRLQDNFLERNSFREFQKLLKPQKSKLKDLAHILYIDVLMGMILLNYCFWQSEYNFIPLI